MPKDEEKKPEDDAAKGSEEAEDEAEDQDEDEGEDEGDESKDEDDADDEDESDEDESDEDEDEASEAKPSAPVEKSATKEQAKPAARPKPVVASHAAPPVRPRPVVAPDAAPPPVAGIGKRVFLFLVLLAVLTGGFFALGSSDTNQPGAARWKAGQDVDVEITLVKDDATALACASGADIGGLKCEYANKADKNAGLDETKMLKPYTTTDQVQFLAAGLWSQPLLEKSKLPAERFAIKCKYHVKGVVKAPLIRWNPTAPWGEKNPDWNAGTVDNCKLVPPT